MLKQRGFTLIELMVAMAIGTVISLALSQIFAVSTRVKAENDRLGLQIENGRFAMDTLQGELAHAAFFGGFDLAAARTVYRAWSARPEALPNPCAVVLGDIRDALPFHVQGYNDVAALPDGLEDCIPDAIQDLSDILVVRRGGTCPLGGTNCEPAPISGTPYFQASYCSPGESATELAALTTSGNWPGLVGNWFRIDSDDTALTLHGYFPGNPNACATDPAAIRAPRRPYFVKIFYLSKNTSGNDGIPALRLAQLQGGGSPPAPMFSSQILVSGIQQIQFEYGMDTNDDGVPDTFSVDPGIAPACVGTACMDNWLNVRAVRVHLLSRGATQSPDYTDRRTFALGLKANNTANDFGPFNDHYRRQYFTETVRLINAGD